MLILTWFIINMTVPKVQFQFLLTKIQSKMKKEVVNLCPVLGTAPLGKLEMFK